MVVLLENWLLEVIQWSCSMFMLVDVDTRNASYINNPAQFIAYGYTIMPL